MLLAPILLLIGIWMLVWNESNLVTHRRALDEGLHAVVDVPAIDTVDATKEGKLIHLVGTAATTDTPQDPIFGVAPTGALKLKRTVEMYQWVEAKHSETKKNTGGSTSTVTKYTYTQEWKDEPVSSGSFAQPGGHSNPSSQMLFASESMTANPILVGAFELSSVITDRMTWYQPLSSGLSVNDITDDAAKSGATVFGNSFYYGSGSPTAPQVGDNRVSFEQVPSQVISIVARQTYSSLSAYTSSNGASVLLVEAGPHDAAEMFQHANQALTMQTWMFRLFGFVLLFAAFQSVLEPLSVAADVIPCVGDIFQAANSFVSFGLALVVSILVVALAWFSYRPLLSIGLLGVVASCVWGVRKYKDTDSFNTKSSMGYAHEPLPTAEAYAWSEMSAELTPTHYNKDNVEGYMAPV